MTHNNKISQLNFQKSSNMPSQFFNNAYIGETTILHLVKNIRKIIMILTCFVLLSVNFCAISLAEESDVDTIGELTKVLNKEKYAVSVASLECEGEAPRDIIESAGCRLVTFPVKRIYGLSGIVEGFRFFRFLKKEKIDILQTYHFSSDIWGAFWGRLAGIKVIISNRRDMGFWRKKRHVFAYRAVNRWITRIIVNSTKRKEMGENGFTKVKEEFSIGSMISKYEHVFSRSRAKRNRILHLVSSGGLFGAEKVILNLARHSGGRVSFAGALKNQHNPHLEIIEEAKRIGINTAIFDSYGRFDLGSVFRIKKFLKENDIAIIHTHNYKSDIVGFLASLFRKTKWVATNHVWHGLDRKLRFYERIDAFVLRFAAQVVAVSNEIKDDLIAKNIPEQKVGVIDNGIDIRQFDRSRSTGAIKEGLGIQENDIVVTIVGRLSPEKGHKTFLKAAKNISAKKNNIKFLIVGDGPIKEELHAEASQLTLNGCVVFAGIRKDMPAIYAISDFMVNASSIEGMPLTILEAMAARVALIVAPVGAVSEVIKQGVNGLVVNTGDAQGLSEGICSLIDDPSKRDRLIERAYSDVCDRFSSETMAARYEQIYESIG